MIVAARVRNGSRTNKETHLIIETDLIIHRRSARRLVVSVPTAWPDRRLQAQTLHHRWHPAVRAVRDGESGQRRRRPAVQPQWGCRRSMFSSFDRAARKTWLR